MTSLGCWRQTGCDGTADDLGSRICEDERGHIICRLFLVFQGCLNGKMKHKSKLVEQHLFTSVLAVPVLDSSGSAGGGTSL